MDSEVAAFCVVGSAQDNVPVWPVEYLVRIRDGAPYWAIRNRTQLSDHPIRALYIAHWRDKGVSDNLPLLRGPLAAEIVIEWLAEPGTGQRLLEGPPTAERDREYVGGTYRLGE